MKSKRLALMPKKNQLPADEEKKQLIERMAVLKKRKPFPKRQIEQCLWRLAQLDYSPIQNLAVNCPHKDEGSGEHSITGKHCSADTGYTVGSVLVPVALPPTSDEHDANLGWREPGENDPAKNEFREASDSLNTIFQWLSSAKDKDATIENIGLKAVALMQAVRPELLSHEGTAAAVGRKFGVTRQAVIRLQKQIQDLSNGRFRHAGNHRTGQDERSRLSLEQHRKAGHKIHTKE